MYKYIKKYIFFAIAAVIFMVLEVTMDLIQPGLMRKIVDDGVLGLMAGSSDFNLIVKYGFYMIGVAILGCICGSTNNVFANYTSQNIGNLMRKDAFKHIMNFSFSQVENYGTGALITRVTNDITQIEAFMAMFIRGMIRTSMLLIGSLICMFSLNSDFGWTAACALPFVIACMTYCMTKTDPMFLKMQAYLDRINSVMQEDISGIRMIKACVREVYEKMRFGKANDNLIKYQLKILLIFAFLNPIANLFMNLAIAIMLWNGAKSVAAGISSPGSIMAAITYTTQLLHSVLMLIMIFQTISRGWVSWKRVREVLLTSPEIKDGNREEINEKTWQIEFKNVSFAYPNTNKTVLKNINLKINKGETVAIMGATGSGKTTLVNLIPRFYNVTGGSVLVDGSDVREYAQNELRDKVVTVLQKSELFSVSVAENISWGKSYAEKEEIIKASKIAQADDFIMNIPDNYESMVAERGMSLSGGQKQRLSIARAILKTSEILIFDDSTSALDLKTEAKFYEELQKEKPDVTKIIIAQRVASVKNSDKIVVLENGEIAACGRHEELLDNCEIYKDIYNSQMGGEVK